MAEEETKQFPDAFSLLRPSANALMLNIWTFLGLLFIAIIFSVISNISGGQLDSPVMLFFYLVSLAASFIIAPAYTIAELRSADDKKIDLVDTVKQGLPYAIRMFLLQILTALVVLVGLLLLIVPGIIAIQRLLLAQYYLVDKDLGIIDAMKASAADAKKYPGAVWGLIGVLLVYMLLLFTILFIPVSIVLLVAYLCAPAIRYYQIQDAAKK